MMRAWDRDAYLEALASVRAECAQADRDDEAWHAAEDAYDEQRTAPRGVLDD